MSSAHIKSGNVETPSRDGGKSMALKYVCKTWDMSKMGQWNGFYSELALYKSSRYLLPLQGDVVPHVIGVYTRPGKIDIAMDLPHPVFWMEASPTMAVVLKDRVVEAFQKLHDKGVVHGDVALRHILIGADARVTLIDFQASRADEPNEDLGLSATYHGDKDLEMRRVKFLLNMDNARKKEFRKSKRALKRSARNKEREKRRRELLQHGITAGLPLDEPEPFEDINEPPVPLDELQKYWMEDANDKSRRFIVPGSSDSEVSGAMSSFLQCIRDMEGADCGWSVICDGPPSPRSPLASPSLSSRHGEAIPPNLPPSIKVRDFAYEPPCRSSSSTSRLQAERDMNNSDPPTSLSMEKGNISSDRVIVLPQVTNNLKRRHEDSEAKVTHIERLPPRKSARLDISLLKERDVPTTAETKLVPDCGPVKAIFDDPESMPSSVSARGCQSNSPAKEPKSERPRTKRPGKRKQVTSTNV
ncbi:hypothetical protein BC826DRAFT_18476 [Russula brevipes]|nr:hypothetical protein BC826DRAFT_18476 [Russula brevipes]